MSRASLRHTQGKLCRRFEGARVLDKEEHGQDARATHGRDAHATITPYGVTTNEVVRSMRLRCGWYQRAFSTASISSSSLSSIGLPFMLLAFLALAATVDKFSGERPDRLSPGRLNSSQTS